MSVPKGQGDYRPLERRREAELQRRCETHSVPQPSRDQWWPARETQLVPCSEETAESHLAGEGLPTGDSWGWGWGLS